MAAFSWFFSGRWGRQVHILHQLNLCSDSLSLDKWADCTCWRGTDRSSVKICAGSPTVGSVQRLVKPTNWMIIWSDAQPVNKQSETGLDIFKWPIWKQIWADRRLTYYCCWCLCRKRPLKNMLKLYQGILIWNGKKNACWLGPLASTS